MTDILILDDSAIIREKLKKILEQNGCAASDDMLNKLSDEIMEAFDEEHVEDKDMSDLLNERTIEINLVNARLQDVLQELEGVQEKLIQSEKSAVLAGRIAGMAHEITTPVGICITGVSFIKEKADKIYSDYKENKIRKSDLGKFLETLDSTLSSTLINLTHASNLIRSFKMVAVDQTSEERRVFNLKDYIYEIILSLRPELKKRKHEIIVNCPEDLVLDSYPGAFYQIINNLIINTLKHAYTPDEEARITINVSRSGNDLIFEYYDEGKGIRKEDLVRIFDPFFTTSKERGGSGLGTHIIYNIVKTDLAGTIACSSIEGKGTTFIITIPI